MGDFNYVIFNLDINAKPRFLTIAKKWLAFESSNSIFDTFRFKCPKRRLYSNTHKSTSKTRIDRIYAPSTLINQIKTTLFHEPGVRDGHKIVEARMFKDIENGPGEWVFKNALLKDEEYTNLIKNKIPAYAINKHEYVVTPIS